jgi:glycogen operon protein
VEFTLPAAPGGSTWTRLIDTNLPDDDKTPVFKTGDSYDVTSRSLLLFSLGE